VCFFDSLNSFWGGRIAVGEKYVAARSTRTGFATSRHYQLVFFMYKFSFAYNLVLVGVNIADEHLTFI